MPPIQTVKLGHVETLALENSVLVEGDVRQALALLPSESIQCAVTSPPYWGLRDYGIAGQIGLETGLADFIGSLVSIFSEVRRVLRPDGVLWLNIGDGFTSGNRGWRAPDKKNPNRAMGTRPDNPPGLKDKDLLGVPWRLAFALQQDGWYLRSEIIWHKPNAMPESVKDRPTRCHEHLFMLTRSERYHYDAHTVRERAEDGTWRNRRSVWSINTEPSRGGHIAPFPRHLVAPCIQSSSRPGDFVMDPFCGSGTVGVVAHALGRRFLGIELNPGYLNVARAAIIGLGTSKPRNPIPYANEPISTPALLEPPGRTRKRTRPIAQASTPRGTRRNA